MTLGGAAEAVDGLEPGWENGGRRRGPVRCPSLWCCAAPASAELPGNGSLDSATTFGTDSSAEVTNGNLDSATVVGGLGEAEAENGNGDLASVVNTGSTEDVAIAGGTSPSFLGSNDIASVLGTDSSAFAGASSGVGNFDLAAVFGDDLNATATGANFLVDSVTIFGTL